MNDVWNGILARKLYRLNLTRFLPIVILLTLNGISLPFVLAQYGSPEKIAVILFINFILVVLQLVITIYGVCIIHNIKHDPADI